MSTAREVVVRSPRPRRARIARDRRAVAPVVELPKRLADLLIAVQDSLCAQLKATTRRASQGLVLDMVVAARRRSCEHATDATRAAQVGDFVAALHAVERIAGADRCSAWYDLRAELRTLVEPAERPGDFGTDAPTLRPDIATAAIHVSSTHA